MIAQPNEVTPEVLEKVVQDLRQKKSLPALQRIRLITFAEGAAAQILHVGPYAAEAPPIERLHRFIHERGGSFDGHQQKHHEIYLAIPRAPRRNG